MTALQVRRGTCTYLAVRVAFNVPVVVAALLFLPNAWAGLAIFAANWLGYIEAKVLV